MPRQVDYYFSLQSPWAYIGHRLFTEVATAHGLKVNYKPVVLVDLFSETGGLPLLKRHPVRQRYRMVELQRWRDKRGLKFHLQPANWPFNARLADGVVIAAIEAGLDPDRYLRRAFAGVWEDQLNLTDPATIAKLADDSGLPGRRLGDRSQAGRIEAAYEQDPQAARAAAVGVVGRLAARLGRLDGVGACIADPLYREVASEIGVPWPEDMKPFVITLDAVRFDPGAPGQWPGLWARSER